MEFHVDHRRVGWKWVRVVCWDWRWFRKLKRKFNSSERDAQRKVDIKAMRTDDDDPWNFRRGIMYSSKCPPKRECLYSTKRES